MLTATAVLAIAILLARPVRPEARPPRELGSRLRAVAPVLGFYCACSLYVVVLMSAFPDDEPYPGFFARLHDFFGTSAQVIGALLVTIAIEGRFVSRRGPEGPQRMLAVQGLVAIAVGTGAATVGPLPELPRQMSACLLGYVLASLVATFATVLLLPFEIHGESGRVE